MALDKTSIVETLSNATVIEIADLVKELENKWGVTAAAPVAVAAPGGGGAAAAPAAEAKTTFDVILVSVPAEKKIAAIKAVREVKAGLGKDGLQDFRLNQRDRPSRPGPARKAASTQRVAVAF